MENYGQRTIIRFDCVSKTFQNGAVNALSNITLAVGEGELLGLIGPNGAGKTTLMRLLLGLLKPTAGEILIAPSFAQGNPEVACVLDADGVYGDLSPRSNFKFFGSLYGIESTDSVARGMTYLDQFGLTEKADIPVNKLSRGQKRIVSLCRAMISQPKLLVVDELTTAFDPTNQRRLLNFMHEINSTRGATIVFSSHDLHSVEELIDHLVLLAHGEKRLDCRLGDISKTYTSYRIECGGTNLPRVSEALHKNAISNFQVGHTTLRAVVADRDGSAILPDQLRADFPGIHIEHVPTTLEDLYHSNLG